MTASDQWRDLLAGDRGLLDRTSAAEQVADVLRQRIIEGKLEPGTQLSEKGAAEALAVSRNTLRESFRLLVHERLLLHEFNRGVFVRLPSLDDVRDLYRARRILEVGALRRASSAKPELISDIGHAVAAGEQAAREAQWKDVGTANMEFHRAVVVLAGSDRVNEAMRHLLAEMRLVFHVMSHPREFHEPYLALNRTIADLLAAGSFDAAVERLEQYFEAAETELVDAYREQRRSRGVR